MSPLLESLAASFEGDAARRAALDAALRDGLPGARSEAWKYTSLRALERRSFAALDPAQPAVVDAALIAGIPAPRLVFVNGVFDAARSDSSGLGEGVCLQPLSAVLQDDSRDMDLIERRLDGADDVFARLNAALARDGALLRIEAGVQIDRPMHFVFVGTSQAGGSDLAWHARNTIELQAGAKATVVEHHLAQGAHAHLGNVLGHVQLAAGAALTHARVQADAAGATRITRTDAALARDARYQRVDLELGAALSRHELNVRLEGEGARVSANGVLFADGRRQLDTRLGIEHIARDTGCDLLWRGLAAGRGRAAFHGGITIRAGADGSDASLSNKNLLLSDQAEIDTQPVLEIHADEVRAAHGATVGQLDTAALFYLRSRGLPEAQARRLLVSAFCREPLAPLPDAVQALLEPHIADALAALEARAVGNAS